MIPVSDNFNGLNPVIMDAMNRLDPEPIKKLVAKIVEAGARAIDINPGYIRKNYESKMRFVVETVQSVTATTLILDSPNPAIIRMGLDVCKQPPIINSISLERHKLDGILPFAAQNNLDLVILLMDESSFSPPSVEEKISIALEISDRCLEAGLSLDKLIFDPVLPSLSWPDAWRRIGEAVKTVRLLSSGAIFGHPVRTMAGLSNLRSGLKRIYPVDIELASLGMLAGAGLEYALVNIFDKRITAFMELANRMS